MGLLDAMRNTCAYCGRRYHLDHPKRCRAFKKHRRGYFAYIIGLCNEYGIPYHLVSYFDSKQWNGISMPIVENPYHMDMLLTPHEIAHWIYAEPHERSSPTFLMKPGRDDYREEHVRLINALILDQEPISQINSLLQSIKNINEQVAV